MSKLTIRNKYNENFIKTDFTCFITCDCSTEFSLASGIPTVDAAGIATTIAENLKTLEQLKEQLAAAQRTNRTGERLCKK